MGFEHLPPNLVTGVASVDGDHDQLFGLVEQFREAKEERNLGLLRSFVAGLVEYTVYHFKREEIGFEITGFSGKANHCAEHRNLEATVCGLEKELAENPQAFTAEKLEEIDAFLVEWLNHHIAELDMAFKDAFNSSPEAIKAMEDYTFVGHLADAAEDCDPLGDILGDLENQGEGHV